MKLSTDAMKLIVTGLYMIWHGESNPNDKDLAKKTIREINLAVMANGGWDELKKVIG